MAEGQEDQTPPRNPRGAPSGYNPKLHPLVVQLLAEQGRTDEQIAQAIGIVPSTLYEWYKKYPELSEAKKKGALEPDDMVEIALFQRSIGYEITEEQALRIKDGRDKEKVEIVTVTKSVPPDTASMIFWLKNRRKEKWRDAWQEQGGAGDSEPLEIIFPDDPAIVDPAKQDNLEISEGSPDA